MCAFVRSVSSLETPTKMSIVSVLVNVAMSRNSDYLPPGRLSLHFRSDSENAECHVLLGGDTLCGAALLCCFMDFSYHSFTGAKDPKVRCRALDSNLFILTYSTTRICHMQLIVVYRPSLRRLTIVD